MARPAGPKAVGFDLNGRDRHPCLSVGLEGQGFGTGGQRQAVRGAPYRPAATLGKIQIPTLSLPSAGQAGMPVPTLPRAGRSRAGVREGSEIQVFYF
jgi:hypothetical protein